MNTYKTLRGIEFDLEITEVGTKSIQVQATCEEGSNTFTIDFPYPIKEDNAFYSQMLDGDTSQLNDEDLEEVMAWVDEVTISFLAGELAKLCLSKSTETEYWTFNIYTYDCVTITFYSMEVDTIIKRNLFHESATGETEIKELINKLK